MTIKSIATLLLVLLFQISAGTTTFVQDQLAVCRAENRRLQASVNNLQRELTTVRGNLEKCQGEAGSGGQLDALRTRLSEANQKLQTCQQEYNRLKGANSDLQGQLDNLKSNRDQLVALERQLGEKSNELQACNRRYDVLLGDYKGLQTTQKNFDQQLKASNDTSTRFKNMSDQLSAEKDALQTQLSDKNKELQIAKDELQASKNSVSELTSQLLSSGQAPSNPEGLMQLAKSSQEQPGQPGAGIVSIYEENGKVHVIRELVIGTLQTIYEKQVKPDRAFPIKAIFKPHPIITPGTLNQPASERTISWFLELQYPSQKSAVSYNQSQSGGKLSRRQIDPSVGEETWVWDVKAPANFDSDVSDLIVFAEYEMATQADPQRNRRDIIHEPIKFQQIIEPGIFIRGFTLLKENLTYVLAVITALVGIWATYVKTKKDKFEYELKQMEQIQKEQALTQKEQSPKQNEQTQTS